MARTTIKQHHRLVVTRRLEVEINYSAFDWNLQDHYDEQNAAEIAGSLNARLEYYVSHGYSPHQIRASLLSYLHLIHGGDVSDKTVDAIDLVVTLIFGDE